MRELILERLRWLRHVATITDGGLKAHATSEVDWMCYLKAQSDEDLLDLFLRYRDMDSNLD